MVKVHSIRGKMAVDNGLLLLLVLAGSPPLEQMEPYGSIMDKTLDLAWIPTGWRWLH